jgi:uncharacterized repeat protein (TIGR02543 family)
MNGGTNDENNPLSSTIESEPITLADPTKTGYTFGGWYTESTFDTRVTEITQGSTGNKEFWAKWELAEYTITYHDGEDIVALSPSTYKYTIGATIDATLTRAGYTFAGWYDNSGLTGEAVTSIPTDAIGNKDLYAKWEVFEYQIQYVLCPDGSYDCEENASNDGRNPSQYNTTQNVTLYDASRFGYDFAGWHDNSGLTGDVIASIPRNSIGPKIFYAAWTPKVYTVSYRCNDNGSVVQADTLRYNDSYEFVSNTGNQTICPRPGWVFTGWICSYIDNNSETHVVSTDPISKWHLTYNVSCVPGPWEETYFNVSFNANSVYVTNPSAMATISCPYTAGCTIPESVYVRNGYLFNGWKSGKGDSYAVGAVIKEQLSDVTMYAQWRPRNDIACVPGTYLKAGDFDKCTNCPVGSYCVGFEAGEYVYNATTDQGIRACRADFGSSVPMVTTDSQCAGSEEIGGCAPSRDYCYVPCETTYGNYVIDSEHSKIRYGQTASSICLYKADIEYKGAENCDTQTYYYSERKSVPLCVPDAVPGKTFIGWIDNKGNEYNNISIANNRRPINDDVPEYGFVTMTADWNVEQYKITYVCDNGNDIVVDGMEYGDTVSLLDYARCNNPGYSLTEWDCGDDFVDDDKMPDHNVKCEAQTTVNTYKIVFDGNGADTGSMDDIENVQYTAEQQLPENNYKRDGYSFDGWCDDATCSGKVYAETETVSQLTPDNDATVVLYAKWEAIPYNISYTVPYGIIVANKTTYDKETPTFTLNNPSVAGYQFNGWCTNAELTENCEQTKTIEKGSSIGDLHFFADIELIEYNIVYKFKDSDGVVHDISDMFAERYRKRTVGQFVAYPKKADVNIPNYQFVAWYGNSNLSGASTTGVASTVTSNTTVWAKVTTLSCKMNQYMKDGICMNCPAHSTSAGGLSSECVCDAGYSKNDDVCDANTITLDWNENGGSLVDNGSCEYGSDLVLPDAPVRDGYTFAGWKLADETIKAAAEVVTNGCVETYTGVNSDTSTDITAQWDIQKYTIKYHSNGGIKYPKKQYTVNSADIILPQNAVRDGYSFAGWYDNENLSGSVVEMVPHGSTGDKDFWAKWDGANYEISYNLNGGEFESGYEPVRTYNTNSDTIVLPKADDVVRDNYTFVGWLDNNNNIVTEIPNGSSGNQEFTAQWTRESCEQNEYLDTSTDSCEACPAHSTSTGGIVTQCDCDNNYVMDNNTCVPKPYTITYYMNGGALGAGLTNPQTYNMDTPEMNLNAPTRKGYTFDGWHLNSITGTTITSISGEMVSYKNIKLYAKWIDNADARTITYNCSSDKTIERTGFVGASVDTPTTEGCEITNGEITEWTCNDGQTYVGTMTIQSDNITCDPVISYADVEYDIIYKGYDTAGNEIDLSFLGTPKYTVARGIRLPSKSQMNIPGYNFEHWYLRYKNSVFSSATNGYAANANIKGTKTFYAKFTVVTTYCDPGSYLLANTTECAECAGNGVYCPGGDIAYSDADNIVMSCDKNYPLSDAGARSADDCYKQCEEREYYTVTGHQYSNGTNNCVYTPITYHIYYDTDGGDAIEPTEYNITMDVITDLPTPEHENFRFAGWYDDNGDLVESVDTSIAQDITLHARYECYENDIEYTDGNGMKQCIPAKFTVNTVDDAGTFSTVIGASGEFYIDCGDGGNFDNSGERSGFINKQNTAETEYKCTWESGTEHTIKYAGLAEMYGDIREEVPPRSGFDCSAAITFEPYENTTNAPKIASISGSLGAIFPTKNDGSGDLSKQPRFCRTFFGSYRLTSLPSNLFDGVFGNAQSMFYATFVGCRGLTELPVDENGKPTLFKDVSGSAAYMFDSTFMDCTGLTEIPSDLFADARSGIYTFNSTFGGCTGLKSLPSGLFKKTSCIAGDFIATFNGCTGLTSLPHDLFNTEENSIYPGQYCFMGTFAGCTNLTTVPADLFAGVRGTPGSLAFYNTFGDDEKLDTFDWGNNITTSYIPPKFFGIIPTPIQSPNDFMSHVFNNTSVALSCPAGTAQYITGLEPAWNYLYATTVPGQKVSCAPAIKLYQNYSANDDTVNTTIFEPEENGVMPTVNTNGEELVAPTREGYVFLGYYNQRIGGTKYYNADMTSAQNWGDNWFNRYISKTEGLSESYLYAQWEEISCETNQYLVGNTCVACPDGLYSEGGSATECGCKQPGYIKTTVWASEQYPANMVTISTYSSSGSDWHADVAPETWMYNYANGMASCRNRSASTGGIWNDENDPTVSGGYCWCKMNDPFATKWIYSGYQNGSNCLANCAEMCGARAKTNSSVRNALFGSAYTDGGADHEMTVCELITYNISYEGLNGATHTNPTTYTVETDTITLDTPVKNGYRFVGWYDNAEFNGTPVTQIDKGSYGDKVFWAKWEFVCQSGKWLRIGNGDDKLCLYEDKPAGAVLVFGTPEKPLYAMLTEDENVPIHNGSSKKLRVATGGKVYNAYDESVNMD